MKGLASAGFEIVPIRRHRSVLRGKVKHVIETLTFAVVDSCKVFGRLMFGRRKGSAFLHLTYSASLVPYELLLTCISRLLGYDSLIYIKGGKIEQFLKSGNRLLLWMFYKNLTLQKCIFLEGQSDIDLLSGKTHSKMVYFPNYVFEKDIPQDVFGRPKEPIGLCYFGKIVPKKNVDLIVETFNLLAADYPKMQLTIVGEGFAGNGYVEKVENMIKRSPFADRISRVGLSDFEYLKHMMSHNHFFLFPTKNDCEGHSNSLNEAMSQGLIPIVSNFHFNATIVRDKLFVVDGYSPLDYADRIRFILGHCNVEALSRQVWQVVKENYTYEGVIGRIVKELRTI